MKLSDPTWTAALPMYPRSRIDDAGTGGFWMRIGTSTRTQPRLRLVDGTPEAGKSGHWEPGVLRYTGEASADEVVRGVERTLEQMDARVARLRELLGDGFGRDDGPRAA